MDSLRLPTIRLALPTSFLTKKNQKMTKPEEVDDIDRELKLIQLERERLALERERAITGVGNAAGAVVGGVGSVFKAIGRFFVRWWKVMLGIAVAWAGIVNFIHWQIERKEEAQRVVLTKWFEGQRAFVTKKCPPCHGDDISSKLYCLEKDFEHQRCERSAEAEYKKQNPEPRTK